jgi:hypothetical protein
LREADASGFPLDDLLEGAFPVSTIAAVARDPAAVRASGWRAADFNFFDGALCDAFGEALLAALSVLLPDLLAVALRAFAGGDLAALFDAVRAAFAGEVFGDFVGDFLRVFLDIRLPFVAFGGSIIELLRVLSPAGRIRVDHWASLMASEYGYKELDIPSVRSLKQAPWAG